MWSELEQLPPSLIEQQQQQQRGAAAAAEEAPVLALLPLRTSWRGRPKSRKLLRMVGVVTASVTLTALL